MESEKAKVCTKVIDIYFNSLKEMDVNCNNCLHAIDIKKQYFYCPMIDSGVNKEFSCPEFIFKDDKSCEKLWEIVMKEVDKNWDDAVKAAYGETHENF